MSDCKDKYLYLILLMCTDELWNVEYRNVINRVNRVDIDFMLTLAPSQMGPSLASLSSHFGDVMPHRLSGSSPLNRSY